MSLVPSGAADRRSPTPALIRLEGLSVYAHHGPVAEERSLGQRFEFDVEIELSDCEACRTDQLGDSIGYEQIAELIVGVATEFRFQMLEALAEAVCAELLTEFGIERVWLRARKPAPAIPYSLAWASVQVERFRTAQSGAASVSALPSATAAPIQESR